MEIASARFVEVQGFLKGFGGFDDATNIQNGVSSLFEFQMSRNMVEFIFLLFYGFFFFTWFFTFWVSDVVKHLQSFSF